MPITAFFFNVISGTSIKTDYVIVGGYTGSQLVVNSIKVRILQSNDSFVRDLDITQHDTTTQTFKAKIPANLMVTSAKLLARLDETDHNESKIENVTINPATDIITIAPTPVSDSEPVADEYKKANHRPSEIFIPPTLDKNYSPTGNYSGNDTNGSMLSSCVRIPIFAANAAAVIINEEPTSGLPLQKDPVHHTWAIPQDGQTHQLQGFEGKYCSHIVKLVLNGVTYCFSHSEADALLRIAQA